MKLLYNLSIYLYTAVARVAALFNSKAKLFIRGRKGWAAKLQENINPESQYIWFHCASLGEFEQGRPVIEEVKKRFPEYKILLTFFSPSGYEIRKNYPEADYICYLPADTRKNVNIFYNIVKPWKAFFIKYEYWYNYLTEAKNRGIPVYIVSAIFRPSQLFFKNNLAGKWYRKTLYSVNHFFVQDTGSEKLLNNHGITNVVVSGDTRFDRVAAIAGSAKSIPVIKKFKSGKPLVVVGSSWQPDEELVVKYINQAENIKFIIAPHEVTPSNINRLKALLKKPFTTYSAINQANIEKKDVIIVDSVGLLSSLYRYGDVAYIGGGFGVGIHNILEAATFGLPIIFGPNYKKFNEACELKNIGAAFPIKNYEELEQNLSKLIFTPGNLHKLSELSRNYIEHNKGATQLIIKKAFAP